MQSNLPATKLQEIQLHEDDIVFAKNPKTEQIWPARLLKITRNRSFSVRFYVIHVQSEVSKDQIWPFDQQTIQTFTPPQSNRTFRRAFLYAKRYWQRRCQKQKALAQLEQDPQQFLDRSFISEPTYFETNSRNLQIPLSRKLGLFPIEEVRSNLEKSSNEAYSQLSEKLGKAKKGTKRRRNEVQLLALSKQQIQESEGYRTRSYMRRMKKGKRQQNNKQNQSQEFYANNLNQQLDDSIMTAAEQQKANSEISLYFNSRSQQHVLQSQEKDGTQKEAEQNVQGLSHDMQTYKSLIESQQQQSLLQSQNQGSSSNQRSKFEEQNYAPQMQAYELQQNNFDQMEQIQQNPAAYGPPNIFDISTEASLNSLQTMPPPEIQNSQLSTLATLEDLKFRVVVEEDPQESLERQAILNLSNPVERSEASINSSQSESDHHESQMASPEIVYNNLHQLLLKLEKGLTESDVELNSGERFRLRRCLQQLKKIPLQEKVIKEMVKLTRQFYSGTSEQRMAFSCEFSSIRLCLDELGQLRKQNRLAHAGQQVLDVLDQYEKGKPQLP